MGYRFQEEVIKKPYNQNVSLNDLQERSIFFKLMIPLIKKVARKLVDDEASRQMMEMMLLEMPIRNLALNGNFTKYGVQGLVEFINGHPIKAFKLMKKEVKIK